MQSSLAGCHIPQQRDKKVKLQCHELCSLFHMLLCKDFNQKDMLLGDYDGP